MREAGECWHCKRMVYAKCADEHSSGYVQPCYCGGEKVKPNTCCSCEYFELKGRG